MKLRALASLLAASSVLAFSGAASAQAADTTRVMGLRFEATLFNPFDVRGITRQGAPNPERIDVFRPNGDIRLGYDLPMGLTPMVGFGLRSHATKDFDQDDKLTEGEGRTDIQLAVELRYYFGPHVRGLQPFVFGEWNTNIASFGTEHPEGTSDRDKELAEFEDEGLGDANSLMNINAGLGMEYKFARSFALGAKWGFGVSLAPTSKEKKTIDGVEVSRNGSSDTVFGTSSSIYAAFRI